ncbi:hypothetical protein GCM10010123_03510 [Pilimelia anulata]|uniref:M23ase beta-sheet core domain-containing protein n=1 Tax=Pilimelia anulata TaxID=53371 RepID=A0A8J3F623_9ACTN|nr:M23 family metallopeptidase [Pilimelia anulata]GGJ76788.1 hypothetical protein GCM10010123_03510 [Pilimelia anulata]
MCWISAVGSAAIESTPGAATAATATAATAAVAAERSVGTAPAGAIPAPTHSYRHSRGDAVGGDIRGGVDGAHVRVGVEGRWPLDGVVDVARPFDPPPEPWRPGHRGVDLGGRGGAVVRAALAGRVLFAGTVAGRGVVSVAHADGLRTTYEPVTGPPPAGTEVVAGGPLGRLAAGHRGCARPACLHWGLRRERDYLDPLAVLGLGRSRLLPLLG